MQFLSYACLFGSLTLTATQKSGRCLRSQALNQLSKGDIVEVKAMGKPPGGSGLGSL